MKQLLEKYGVRAGMAACLLAFVLLIIPAVMEESPSSTPFDTVVQKTLENVDASVYPAQDAAYVRQALGLNVQDYEGLYFGRQDDGMKAEEVLIVKFAPDQKESLEQAVEARIEARKTAFENYAPEAAALMEQAVVDIHPNYLFYGTGEAAGRMAGQFGSVL